MMPDVTGNQPHRCRDENPQSHTPEHSAAWMRNLRPRSRTAETAGTLMQSPDQASAPIAWQMDRRSICEFGGVFARPTRQDLMSYLLQDAFDQFDSSAPLSLSRPSFSRALRKSSPTSHARLPPRLSCCPYPSLLRLFSILTFLSYSLLRARRDGICARFP